MWAVRERVIRQRDTRGRSVEIVEGLAHNVRHDVRTPSAGRGLLLDGNKDVGSPHAVADWRDVQGPQHLDVDHFRLDAFGVQTFGGGKSLPDHREAGDNCGVTAGPQHPRAAWHRHIINADRRRSLHRQQRLVLKHENRIVVADRGLQHQIGLFGIGGTDDLDPRHRQEPGLGGLRVLGAESQAGSAESPNDDRRLDAPARHEAVLGDAVGDLIEADPEEVGEHNLDDGPVAGQRETQRRADEAGLRDRRIADALRAKLFIETVACLEGAAGLANILAHDQGLRIAPHLLAQRRDNRLAVGDLLGDPFNRLDPGRNDFLIRPHWTNIVAIKSCVCEGHGAAAARSAAALTSERASAATSSAPTSDMRPAARRSAR